LRRAAGEAQSLREVARRRYETTFAPSVVTDQLLTIYKDVASAGVRR